MNKLDMKQSLAFQIDCDTLILDGIEKDIYYKLKETSRDDNTRKILSNILNSNTKKTLDSLISELKNIDEKII